MLPTLCDASHGCAVWLAKTSGNKNKVAGNPMQGQMTLTLVRCVAKTDLFDHVFQSLMNGC